MVFQKNDAAIIFGSLVAASAVKYAFSAYSRRSKLRSFQLVGHVSGLNIYPVKSCSGIAVQNADCTRLGIKVHGVTDRHWLVIKENGDFVTQRQIPRMALIKVSIHGSNIHIEAPDMETLKLPVNPKFTKSGVVKCRIWLWKMDGLDCGLEAAQWLSKFLNQDGLRLLFSAPELEKKDASLETKPWGNPALLGDQAAFCDSCGYLLLSEQSIDAINSRLENKVTQRNFRPNILLNVDEAFAEDTWQEVRIGDKAYLRILDHCTRCVLTTVDPNKGIKSKDSEPLETLKRFRCFKTYGASPIFGVNGTVDVEGPINVGDPVYAILRENTKIV